MISSDQEIVDAVLAILGPYADDDDVHRQIEREICMGRTYVRRNSKANIASGRFGVTNDKQKRAAKKAASKLRAAQAALRDPELRALEIDSGKSDAMVESLAVRYEEWAVRELPDLAQRAVDHSAREAAHAAARILKIVDLSPSLAKGGKFVRIAATIYGDPGRDMRRTCSAVLGVPVARKRAVVR